MASDKLIQSVINGVVLETSILDTGLGKYKIDTILSVCWGARNRPKGYFIHVYEQGGPYKNDSFYEDIDGAFVSKESAAIAAIRRRRILAIDTQGNVIRGRKNEN